MNSLNSLPLLLLVLPVLLAVDFSCGSGKKQNAIALKYVNRHCPKGRGSYDVCCKIHDECYSKKKGKPGCDSRFCTCLEATSKRVGCKNVVGKSFCIAVTVGGHIPYYF